MTTVNAVDLNQVPDLSMIPDGGEVAGGWTARTRFGWGWEANSPKGSKESGSNPYSSWDAAAAYAWTRGNGGAAKQAHENALKFGRCKY